MLKPSVAICQRYTRETHEYTEADGCLVALIDRNWIVRSGRYVLLVFPIGNLRGFDTRQNEFW